MEYIDIYDEQLKYICKMKKNEAHKNGAWHKSIHCWILRKDEMGEYIIFQKRSNTKKNFPNYLDISAAGHYKAGEKIEDGIREITEELGINVKFNELKYLGTKFDIYKDDKIFNREFCETFIYQDNRKLAEYPIDCDEVTGLVQIKIDDGLNLFSGKVEKIHIQGIEYFKESNKIEQIEKDITKKDFISRIDPYYGKIFMIAKAFFSGETQLFI